MSEAIKHIKQLLRRRDYLVRRLERRVDDRPTRTRNARDRDELRAISWAIHELTARFPETGDRNDPDMTRQGGVS